ncbi:MAG: siderophore-interacting protein [Mycobacteriaceae bacterium]|nr:siderophore-interacting protein [Mycobacteriaceae bacterium]
MTTTQSTRTAPGRGWQGAVLKAMRAPDFELTVTKLTELTAHYVRLSFSGGGLLADRDHVHPTMWIRMWFPTGKGSVQQRGYTVLNADLAADTFDIEFAIHDGPAANWAKAAQPGDTITATVMGSKFALPEPRPAGYVMVGDTASLPAITTLLAAIGESPAKVWLEWQHEDDKQLAVEAGENVDITWVARGPGAASGSALLDSVESAAFDAADHFGWVACDMKTTRAAVKLLRAKFNLEKKSIKSQAYWVA